MTSLIRCENRTISGTWRHGNLATQGLNYFSTRVFRNDRLSEASGLSHLFCWCPKRRQFVRINARRWGSGNLRNDTIPSFNIPPQLWGRSWILLLKRGSAHGSVWSRGGAWCVSRHLRAEGGAFKLDTIDSELCLTICRGNVASKSRQKLAPVRPLRSSSYALNDDGLTSSTARFSRHKILQIPFFCHAWRIR